VLLAKQLLHETQMPVTQIALASGFGSVRRFNECFQKLFNRPPISLRRRRGEPEQQGRITLLLRYRPPYDWNAMLSFLGARAIPGVECLGDRTYLRTFAANGSAALIAIANVPGQSSLRITLDFPNSPAMRSLPDAVARVRRVFDLGADVTTISDHLSRDPRLAPLVASHPGLRVPGGWDPFELAVRAVLGQQISVEAARNLTGRLVALCGTEVTTWHTLNQNLNRLFPTAEQVAAADLSLIGMPGTRRTTLRALAVRIHERPAILEGFGSLEEALTRLRDIPGIGPWTAEYIALRALREPDAFPASDLGLLRSAGELSGTRPTAADLLRQAEDWRPWRAYAAQHLWTSEAAHE
jgi:AraC family transcriptional regulator of adaptative response / DNA-3-methyladenine glycosylase II